MISDGLAAGWAILDRLLSAGVMIGAWVHEFDMWLWVLDLALWIWGFRAISGVAGGYLVIAVWIWCFWVFPGLLCFVWGWYNIRFCAFWVVFVRLGF